MHGGIEAAFRKLESEWDNPEAHRRFITLCSAHDALAEGGRLYRIVKERDPSRAAEAARKLDAVTLAAVEQLALTRTPRAARRSRTMWLMVGACGFAIVYAILTLLRARSH